MHDQKYQKSSKPFPLRYLPVLAPFAKARSAPRLCQRTDFVHARHTFICGRGTGAYANLLDSFVGCVRTRGIEKAMGRDNLDYFALSTARTHLPRNIPCDSVAYAEGVQKRKAFLFLSFSYFSDRRKVHGAFLLLFGQAKSTPCFIVPFI